MAEAPRDLEAQMLAENTARLVRRVELVERELVFHVSELWGYIEREEQEHNS